MSKDDFEEYIEMVITKAFVEGAKWDSLVRDGDSIYTMEEAIERAKEGIKEGRV